MSTIDKIKIELKKFSSREKSKVLSRFFKTGKGEYAEGDKFIGVVVPDQRMIAKKFFRSVALDEITALLQSNIHEHRLTALFLLIMKYNVALGEESKKNIVDIYLSNRKFINNWDLVDLSAEKILGDYLYNFDKPRKMIYDFAKDDHLWTQRIAILTTFYFIRKNDFNDTLRIAKIFLDHEHDLIHKASGWMLREIGKRDFSVEYDFLQKHYKRMPRTMLRYAIEKFKPELKEKFLNGTI